MLTIIFVSIMFALLIVVGLFAMMAKHKRKGQSGSPDASSGFPQGRASGPD